MRRLALALLVLLLACPAPAATITADSLSYADVGAAISNAVHGDTVILPAGTNTWESTSEITGLQGITLRGAGRTSTVIKRGTNSTTTLLTFRKTGTNQLVIRDLMLDSQNIKVSFGLLSVGNSQSTTESNMNYRIHDCEFVNIGSRGLMISGIAQGVTWDCRFHATTDDRPQPYTIYGLIRNQASRTNVNPLGPIVFGSITNTPYIEDCVWDHVKGGDGAADGYADARSVFRFNRMTNASAPFAVHELEGNRYATSWEFYGNIMVADQNSGIVASSHLRSGAGLVFSNTIITTDYVMSRPQPFLDFYAASGTNVFQSYYTSSPPVSINGTRRWDGNWNSSGTNWGPGGDLLGLSPGYPAMDQLGWGDPVTWMENSGTPTFYGCYAWSNTYQVMANAPTNVPWLVRVYDHDLALTNSFGGKLPGPQHLIIEDRDYFNYPKPDYTPAPYPHPFRGGLPRTARATTFRAENTTVGN